MKERDYILWINSLNKISVKDFYNIYEYFKDIQSIYFSDRETLVSCKLLNDEKIEEIINSRSHDKLEYVLGELEKKQIKFMTINDEGYPFILKNIHLPPPVLYYRGDINADLFQYSVSIVGSRNASYYGLKASEKIAEDLVKAGITVISGLARGIDTMAHLGALKGNGKTVGVLGCGLDIIYPKENKNLYERIAETGAVITEFSPGTQPLPYNFPRRNRIISGLSMGTVVVEATKKSGSLITAQYALDQGREVYSLPGNVNNANSIGTNQLIKDGAKVITSSKDILEDIFPMFETASKGKSKEMYTDLNEEERKIVEYIKLGFNNKDELFLKAQLPIANLQYILTSLEIKNIIVIHKGNYYIK